MDDHRMFADALELLLSGEEGLESMGVASSVKHAVDLVRRGCPDVVLMDVELPGTDGIEGIRVLREICPTLQAVVITALQETDVLTGAVEAGACGFVPKTQAADELIRVIHRAAEGELVIPEGQIGVTLERLRAARGDGRGQGLHAARLTPREVDILQAFTEGLSMRQVAERVFVSPHTVKAHMGSILRKLGCRSTLQAVLLGLRHGLVELREG